MLRYEVNSDVKNRQTKYVAQKTKIKRQNRKYRKMWKVVLYVFTGIDI